MTNRSYAKFVTVALLCAMTCASRDAEAVTIGSAVPKQPVNVFYADPVKGTMNGDGSQARPWSTLEAVLSANLVNGQDRSSGAVHAGDVIYLMSGNHGNIHIDPWHNGGKFANTDFITIQAAPSNIPVINSLEFQNASFWVVRGLTIQNPPNYTGRGYLASFSSVSNILFDGNVVYSVPNAVSWTPSNWAASSSLYGLYIDGVTSCTFSNNKISNVENGAYLGGNGIFLPRIPLITLPMTESSLAQATRSSVRISLQTITDNGTMGCIMMACKAGLNGIKRRLRMSPSIGT